MKLFYLPASPFVRKVIVTAIETGLDDQIERITGTVVPQPLPELLAANPLGKVPALITDGGEALFDSPVICEYLDSLHGGQRLFPAEGGARWRALRWQALGDGIMEAAVLVRYESLRPQNEQSPSWLERQRGKVLSAIAVLDDEAELLRTSPMSIGQITIGCALGYIDFRAADLAWRNQAPALAAWYATFSERPSMKVSAPPATA